MHALQAVQRGVKGRGKKGGIRAYAEEVGKSHTYLVQLHQAAKVFQVVIGENGQSTDHFLDKAQHLAAIHKAPQDTWPVLVDALLARHWTAAETETAVKRVADVLAAVPAWWTTLDQRSLAGLVAFKDGRGLRAMLQRAGAMAAGLEPVTLYSLLETDDVDRREGRDYRRYVAVPEAYDPASQLTAHLRALPVLAQTQHSWHQPQSDHFADGMGTCDK